MDEEYNFVVNNRKVIEVLKELGMEPVLDVRCWTCGNGVPLQPNWGCNEGDDIHSVIVGARMKRVVHPDHG